MIFSFSRNDLFSISHAEHLLSDRKGQLLRNSQRKLCETGIISRSSYPSAKVKMIQNGISNLYL